jgi:hypothetical protein
MKDDKRSVLCSEGKKVERKGKTRVMHTVRINEKSKLQ